MYINKRLVKLWFIYTIKYADVYKQKREFFINSMEWSPRCIIKWRSNSYTISYICVNKCLHTQKITVNIDIKNVVGSQKETTWQKGRNG